MDSPSMDAFLALVNIDGEHFDRERLTQAARRAIHACANGSHGDVAVHADETLVFAHAATGWASDAAVFSEGTGQLVYVNGPVTALGADLTDRSEQPHPEPIDQRLLTVRAAVGAASANGVALAPIEQLSGSFHALVHDPAARRTTVVTDHLGSRPMFWCRLDGMLCLASDIRALLALPGVRPILDLESVAQFVRIQMMLQGRTLYRDLRVLPPATLLQVDHRAQTLSSSTYWRLTRLAPYDTSEDAIVETARVFQTATHRLAHGSRRLSVLLSGGLDARMILACLGDELKPMVTAHTYGPETSDESRVAKRVASLAGVEWSPIAQDATDYLQAMTTALPLGNGLYSLYHAHTARPAASLVAAGFDTAFDGWGLDLTHSGSYLPKESFRLLKRNLYTYRLGHLTAQGVAAYMDQQLDMQGGCFEASLLGEALREPWESSAPGAIGQLLEDVRSQSDDPLDWVDYALFGGGISAFRSYPVVLGIRGYLRERNPLFERDVLEVYQRLPPRWRFLGPVFRRAMQRLNPALAQATYSNVGTSPLASPMRQALSFQVRTTWRGNIGRVRGIGARMGLPSPLPDEGASPSAARVARELASSGPVAVRMRQVLLEGTLAQSDLVRPLAIERALTLCRTGERCPSWTLLALASLALWIDANPVEVR